MQDQVDHLLLTAYDRGQSSLAPTAVYYLACVRLFVCLLASSIDVETRLQVHAYGDSYLLLLTLDSN